MCRSLDTLNQALMTDVQAHYADPKRPYPGIIAVVAGVFFYKKSYAFAVDPVLTDDESPLMSEVASYLDCAGLNAPLTKIYVTTKKLQSFALNIFFFVLSQLSKLTYSKVIKNLF
jgi:WASH complex subunit strumpellin